MLIAAAVLVLLSLVSHWFFQSKLSLTYQQRSLQNYISEQQQDIESLFKDTALLRKLVVHKETQQEFSSIEKKKYGLFVFAETIFDNQDIVYWNRHNIIPPTPEFARQDGVSFKELVNGHFVVHKKGLHFPGITSNYVVYALIPVLEKILPGSK